MLWHITCLKLYNDEFRRYKDPRGEYGPEERGTKKDKSFFTDNVILEHTTLSAIPQLSCKKTATLENIGVAVRNTELDPILSSHHLPFKFSKKWQIGKSMEGFSV
jgi:hypothetical protein